MHGSILWQSINFAYPISRKLVFPHLWHEGRFPQGGGSRIDYYLVAWEWDVQEFLMLPFLVDINGSFLLTKVSHHFEILNFHQGPDHELTSKYLVWPFGHSGTLCIILKSNINFCHLTHSKFIQVRLNYHRPYECILTTRNLILINHMLDMTGRAFKSKVSSMKNLCG